MSRKTIRVILGCDPLLMQLTGIGHYTKQLGNALNGQDELESFKLFAHGKFFSSTLLDETFDNTTATKQHQKPTFMARLRQQLASSQRVVKLYQLISPHIMRWSLRRYPDYIFHSPNFTLPPFSGKTVVTIHDLSTLRFPQYHPSARVKFLNDGLATVVKQADHIITDSEFVKTEIIELLGAEPDKITAVPLGADALFAPRNASECNAVLNEYQLQHKRFFLFVSTLEPRKNLVNLLQAFSNYRQEHPEGMPLVLVGAQGWHSEKIHNKVLTLVDKGWVKYLGYTSQSHLVILYSGARALLFPSIYEGFGLPVLEAMQSGTPVMTCADSAMSEITLNYAALTDKDDIEQMTTHITRLSTDDDWVNQLTTQGLLRAKDFSWNKCVEQTLTVYKSL
jgi:glycosyltransferase involved in cell wall biosynthesis